MSTTTGTSVPLRGLDSRHKPEPGTARKCESLTWDLRGGWREGPGFRALVTTQVPANPDPVDPFSTVGRIQSLHMLQMGNGARTHLIFESDDDDNDEATLWVFNPSRIHGSLVPYEAMVDPDGNAITNRTVLKTPWQRTQSMVWGNRIYLINGYQEPLVWNGRYAERAGWDQVPPAPMAFALDTAYISRYKDTGGTGIFTLDPINGFGIGDDTNKTAYVYAVTWVNERGEESPLSPGTSPVALAAAGSSQAVPVQLHIPVGPDHCAARRIYRSANLLDSSGNYVTTAGSETLYYHSTIEDNETEIIEDFLPDTQLGSRIDPTSLGAWPAGARYGANWGGCTWLAGMSANEIRYSLAGHPETFPPDNVFSTADATGGPITGLFPTRSSLLVFKNSSIHRISGNPVDGFRIQTLTRAAGCAAPNAIVEVPGLGVVFLSETGIKALVGDRTNSDTPIDVMDLSEPISDQVQRLNRSALMNACACLYKKDREVWFSVPTLGSALNNLILVLHYGIGQWSTRTGWPVSCMIETQDSRGYLVFGSNVTTTGNVGLHVVSHGWQKAGSATITPVYETNDLDFGLLYRNFQPRHVMVFGLAVGDNDLTVNYRVNRSMADIRASADTTDQQDPNERLAVYGTATWGTSAWCEHRAAVFRYDVHTGSKGPVHEFRAKLSPSGRRLHLLGLDIERAQSEQQNIKPLHSSLTSGAR